jgi:hypothetical protein
MTLYWYSCVSDNVVSATSALSWDVPAEELPLIRHARRIALEPLEARHPMVLHAQPGMEQRAAAQRLRRTYHQINELVIG